jgi:hypothetical protein
LLRCPTSLLNIFPPSVTPWKLYLWNSRSFKTTWKVCTRNLSLSGRYLAVCAWIVSHQLSRLFLWFLRIFCQFFLWYEMPFLTPRVINGVSICSSEHLKASNIPSATAGISSRLFSQQMESVTAHLEKHRKIVEIHVQHAERLANKQERKKATQARNQLEAKIIEDEKRASEVKYCMNNKPTDNTCLIPWPR